jgi:hypothetical protein
MASFNGITHVVMEMVCKLVIEDVHNGKENRSEYGMTLQNCREFLKNHNNYKVVFARRQTNGRAHALARASISYASRIVFDVIPNCIATIIINKMP